VVTRIKCGPGRPSSERGALAGSSPPFYIRAVACPSTPGTELAGKVALVTGGGRNIGRAVCRALAAGGAAVMVNARTSHGEARETVSLIEADGGTAALHLADVTEPAAVASMVDATVGTFGRLDVLVNNAAVRRETPFGEISFEEWRRVLATVLDGAFLCTQACLPHMLRARGGAIVNIGGLTGHKGAAGRAHVVTAKAGIAGMTRALALDLAPHGITVNCVVPGTIETTRGSPGAPDRPPDRRGVPPIGRRGEPFEVAAMVRMLCGPDARYITGQAIHVNGGGFMP
jgi:3-oxoacyl-[acyl-carrier protein] reductase